jgi:hypothetical protein
MSPHCGISLIEPKYNFKLPRAIRVINPSQIVPGRRGTVRTRMLYT